MSREKIEVSEYIELLKFIKTLKNKTGTKQELIDKLRTKYKNPEKIFEFLNLIGVVRTGINKDLKTTYTITPKLDKILTRYEFFAKIKKGSETYV